jgi:mRNA-degrading endonuclease toxin of MazEF toxin-antitoxin module
VPVGIDHGLKSPSVVNLDHIYTVAQDDLRLWLGRLNEERMTEICAALEIALGCA